MDKMFYGKRLRLLRVVHGLTVTELATKLGLSKQAVSKFETGELKPSAVVLSGIIKMYSLPDNFFSTKKINVVFNGNSLLTDTKTD